jgi:hypothetical protein
MTLPPENGDGELDPTTVAELRQLARLRPRSGREAVAKASAIRTLERLSRGRLRQEAPPMPEGWYPHERGEPFYELDWGFLHDNPEILRRHWERAWLKWRVISPRWSRLCVG